MVKNRIVTEKFEISMCTLIKILLILSVSLLNGISRKINKTIIKTLGLN